MILSALARMRSTIAIWEEHRFVAPVRIPGFILYLFPGIIPDFLPGDRFLKSKSYAEHGCRDNRLFFVYSIDFFSYQKTVVGFDNPRIFVDVECRGVGRTVRN